VEAPIVDVKLSKTRELVGQLVDRATVPVAAGRISVLRDGKPLTQVTSDEDGRFTIRFDRGGVYQLKTEAGISTVRIWTQQAAPPHCRQRLLLVQGDVARGQIPRGTISPWVIAGVVAVAIAVPVAIHNHREDRADGS
jgi:hypothetical protein